ncbi:DJ-1 family protein [Neoconidiobolus thromboides FSU 785]|nr:DJ-1 family protein [Neoconidiobolus thromboides FSU 785]
MSTKKVLVFLAHGSEEMEVVIVSDILIRAGIQVTILGINVESHAVCSRGIKLIPDTTNSNIDVTEFDGCFIPGGAKGSENLAKNDKVLQLVRQFFESNKLVAAVCAGPTVLKEAKVAAGFNLTCHPTVKQSMTNYNYKEEKVVKQDNLITGAGPGACFELGLAISQYLVGDGVVDNIKPGLIL